MSSSDRKTAEMRGTPAKWRKRNGPHTPPSKPAVDPKIKARYLRTITKRMERFAGPLGINVKIESLDDVKAFLNKLLQLQSDRRIEPHEMRTMTNACEVLRKIYQPSDLEEQVDELLKVSTSQLEAIERIRRERETGERA